MKILILSVAALALFTYAKAEDETIDKDEIPVPAELRKVLKKLVDLIEANQMNVSVVSTEQRYWTNGQLKEITGFTMHMPTNNVHLTESKISDETVQEWMDAVSEVSGYDALAGARKALIKDGNTVEVKKSSIEGKDFYESPLYKSIVTVKDGQKGFVMDNPNHESYYNILLDAEEAKTKSEIEVIVGSVETKVIKKSDNMPEEEIAEIEQELPRLVFMYDDNALRARMLVEHMDKAFDKDNWQVIVNPGNDFYVTNKKYVLLKVANLDVLVFARD